MEKKEIKISLGTVICICIIVILLAVIGVMYFKMQNMNSKDTLTKQEEIRNAKDIDVKEEKTSDIPVEDLYAIDYETIKFFEEEAKKANMNISLAKISNGVLYYLDVNSIETMNYISPCKENYKKIDTEVKRIKTLTLGSDTTNNYLIIKEDGTVKSLNIKKDGISYETYETLSDYKVDDITNFDGETFSLKLLDGTNVTKKRENLNNDIAEDIKEYILTEFGPKGNMENVTINEVKILPKEDSSKNMHLDVNIKNNESIVYGSCIYSITLKDPSKLTMEGSKSSVDKLEGNVYTLDADFTYDKTTNKVKFYTSYRFGN